MFYKLCRHFPMISDLMLNGMQLYQCPYDNNIRTSYSRCVLTCLFYNSEENACQFLARRSNTPKHARSHHRRSACSLFRNAKMHSSCNPSFLPGIKVSAIHANAIYGPGEWKGKELNVIANLGRSCFG